MFDEKEYEQWLLTEYKPICGGGGDTHVQAPQPSSEEIALQREQLEILREQREESQLLKPFILSTLRLKETPEGTYAKLTEEEYKATLTDTELRAYENTLLAQERERKALLGELPITEATKQRKMEEFGAFKEAMARKGTSITGETPETAIGTSTAGTQGLKAFQERWGLLEEAERRGELTAGSSAVLQKMGVASDIGARQYGLLAGYPTRTTPTFQAYSAALQPYQYQRGMEFDAAKQSAILTSQNRAGLLGGIGQLVGTAGGAWIMASTPDVKKDIKKQTSKEEERVLDMIKDTDTYSYRYKDEPSSEPKHIGLMTTTAPPEIVTSDKQGIDLGRQVGLLNTATKVLIKKVKHLEGGK